MVEMSLCVKSVLDPGIIPGVFGLAGVSAGDVEAQGTAARAIPSPVYGKRLEREA